MRVANLHKANLLKLWKVIEICFFFHWYTMSSQTLQLLPRKTYPPHTIMGTASVEASPPKQTEACRWWQEAGPDSVTANLVISPLHHVPNCSPWHFSSMFIWALASNKLEVKQNHKISNSWNHDQDCMHPSAGSFEATKYCDYLEEAFFPHLCCTWVLFFK